jgi:hypothetical protein
LAPQVNITCPFEIQKSLSFISSTDRTDTDIQRDTDIQSAGVYEFPNQLFTSSWITAGIFRNRIETAAQMMLMLP